MSTPNESPTEPAAGGWIARLQRRGVIRVGASYAVIAWLLLQIADVVVEPLGVGVAAIRVLMLILALGFPVALALAWFFELTPRGVEVDRGPAGSTRPAVGGLRGFADVIIISVLVITVGLLLARQGGLMDDASSERVLAVLPFDNLSAGSEYEHFGDGLADTLIQKLGQLDALIVLASQSTFQFKGRHLDLGEIGGKLGATAILTGSVQRAGRSLRINARLVDVGSGRQLWADSFDRGVEDVFAIHDEIAASVSDALALVLSADAEQRLTRPATTSLTAYDAYVLGAARLASRTASDRQRALEYFREAIAADPDYALAYTGLVEALYLETHNQFYLERDALKRLHAEAVDAAGRAMALDPELGEAWLARAQVAIVERDLMDGSRLSDADIVSVFERAVTLSPNDALARKYFSTFLADIGDSFSDRAFELLQEAAVLDPRSGIILLNLGSVAVERGNVDNALSYFRKALRTREPYFPLAFRTLIQTHLCVTGRLDEAARWSHAWLDQGPNDQEAPYRHQIALIHLGDWREARATIAAFAREAEQHSGTGFNDALWNQLTEGMLLARVEGDLELAHDLARRLSAEFWEGSAEWPVLQRAGWHSMGMTSLALWEIRQGQADRALARYEAAYPGPFESIDMTAHDALSPVVMKAALYKLDGQKERAEALLEDYLAYLDSARLDPFWMPGWAKFISHALLGQTDQAIAALEETLDDGFRFNWWMLTDGAFDPDYARVLADPRFRKIHADLEANIARMRESYFARPAPPEGDAD